MIFLTLFTFIGVAAVLVALRNREFFTAAVMVLLLYFVGCMTTRADTPSPATVSVILDTDGAEAIDVEQLFEQVNAIYKQTTAPPFRVVFVESAHIADDTQPDFLLTALEQYRDLHDRTFNTAFTVFLTMRDLRFGNTHYAGYASQGLPCGDKAAAIVQVQFNYRDTEVLAHELAHIYAVPHDGTGACANTEASGHIMQAFGIGSNTFSQCSVDIINEVAANTACYAPPKTPVSLSPPSSGGGAIDWWVIPLFVFLLGVAVGLRRDE